MKNLIITSVFILSGLFAQVDYEADIQPIWDNNCTSCHVYGHSSGLNLSTSGVSYNNLVDVVSQNYAPALRVATGDPGSSVLYDKISGGGTYGGVMPPSGQMTASNIALVQTWITELSQTDGLFFSEYAEGSSNNKYIEIYNGTGADVDLSDYAIVRYNNGSTTDENLFTFSATLTSGEVYVIANADADPTGILPYNDDDGTNAGVTWFNGDDYLGLIYDANGDGTFDNSSEVIDVIGLFGEDPGSGWDVAGVSTATGEHTLVRKSSVTSGNTDWSVSAGTDADNSEWIVYPQNTWDYIGSHPHVDPAIAISSPTNGATFYSPDVTVSFDVSNFDVDYVAGGGDGHIHYALDAGITVMQFTSNDIALTGLAETSHTFIIWLVDDSHANLSPHVADTVSFTVAPALTTTPIFDIQSGTVAVETIVTIKGIVTAGSGETPDGSAAFYMQEGTGQYSGINVYSTGFSVNRGDSVFVTGEYVEYYDKTEISNVTDITVISTDVTLPTAEVLTLDQTDWEPWEGVLISIQNITVADDDAGFGEWKVNIGVDTLVIDNAGNYTYSPTNGDFISSITGPLNYTYSYYKIIPRDDIDIDLTGDSPSISNIVTEPTSPTNADDVTVSASITDNGSIASAVLTYNAGAGGTDVAMTNSTGDIYTGTIPAQNAGTTVTFSITATDDEGNSSTSDETSYYVVSSGGEITAIYDIQYVSDPDADDVSPLLGQTVTISGVVTAEFWGSSYNSVFFVQDSLAPWSGIMVYTDDSWDTFDFATSSGIVHSLAEGDSVTLTGEVYEHNNKTEINNVTEVIIHGTTANEFAPMTVTVGQVMTGGSDAEAYEGCLIMVVDVSVESENPDAPNNDYGEWSVTDGTNSMRVDDTWDYYFYPEVGQSLSEIVGLLDYSLLNFKLQPRLARDVMEEDVTRIQRINQVLHSDLMKVADDNVSDMSYYMEGDTVTLEGIVTVATGLAYAGTGIKLTFEDYNGGPWSGMVCYSADPSALGTQPIGRKIRATGVISEYGHDTYDGNVTEIDIVQPIQVLGFDPTAVPVDTIHTGDLRDPLSAEQWGAVWIEINDAMVTQNDLDYGQWTIDDGTGEIKIGTNSEAEEWTDWVRPPVGAFVESIRGWVYNRHGYNSDSTAYKLEPNYPSDITFGAGPPIIAEVQRDPCVVTPSDQVQVSTMITDNSTISQAFVHFRYDGGVWDSAAMSLGADDIWQGDIPSSSSDDVFVEYYISAYDDGVDQIEIKSSHFPNIEVGNYMGYISKNGDLTIYDIQFSPWPSGVSPYIDCSVTLTGIVTVDSLDYSTGSYNSYAMQSASAQWSGIFFDGDNLPGLTRGDEITISGKVYEYYGSTNVDSVTTVSILSSNNVVSPLLVGTADLAQDSDETEAYEGCLVNVSNVTVSDANQYDWSIKDESNISCLMDDDMATMEAVNFMFGLEIGSALETVSGIFNFSYGTYKIEVRDMADLGQLSIDNDFSGITREFALYPNFPNPFNPETRIRFQLAENSNVRLMIYDVLGRKVRMLVSDRMDAGHHVLNWDGLNDAGTAVASGMYVYRIKAGDFIAHRKMLLVR